MANHCGSALCLLHENAPQGLDFTNALHVLRAAQIFPNSQVQPPILATKLCCAQIAVGALPPAGRLCLGSFVAQQQRDNQGRVRRIACDCITPCRHGRWACQSATRIPVPHPNAPHLTQYTVVRETLRWLEWDNGKFRAAPYMVWAIGMEEGDVAPSPALQNLINWFQWDTAQGAAPSSRFTLCQASFDPPRRVGVRRNAGTALPGPPAQRRRTVHIATPVAPTLPASPPTPQRQDFTQLLRAAVDRLEHVGQRLAAARSAEAEALFAELLEEHPVVVIRAPARITASSTAEDFPVASDIADAILGNDDVTVPDAGVSSPNADVTVPANEFIFHAADIRFLDADITQSDAGITQSNAGFIAEDIFNSGETLEAVNLESFNAGEGFNAGEWFSSGESLEADNLDLGGLKACAGHFDWTNVAGDIYDELASSEDATGTVVQTEEGEYSDWYAATAACAA